MKKLIALLILACLALGAGCASNTLTAPLTDKDGNLVKDGDKLVTISGDITDSAMYHFAQMEAMKLRKPIAELKFPEGGEMPRGAVFTVWGPNGNTGVKQYEEPWKAPASKLIGMTPFGLMAWTTFKLADGIKGDTNNYNGDINAQGSNVNLGRGTQNAGASYSNASAEGASATGGSPTSSYAPEDNSQSSQSLGLDWNN